MSDPALCPKHDEARTRLARTHRRRAVWVTAVGVVMIASFVYARATDEHITVSSTVCSALLLACILGSAIGSTRRERLRAAVEMAVCPDCPATGRDDLDGITALSVDYGVAYPDGRVERVDSPYAANSRAQIAAGGEKVVRTVWVTPWTTWPQK